MLGDGGLVAMSEQGYASEDLLQGLLADHPDLLAGDQIDTNEPRRWALVSREMPLASEEDGSGRWSVDHLFLDQDAIPTIVEVKRSTDTRIRREVVGQMLDYAANAVVYWPAAALRERFEGDGQDLTGLLGPDADPEEFWGRVKTNLQAGKVRLIFVADEIPAELRRVVEFLNGQMDPAEVLAVEVKQYVGDDLKTLVPRVVGQTVKAQPGTTSGGRRWNEDSFFRELGAQAPAAVGPARAIFGWATDKASRVGWGKGKQYGTFYPVVAHEGTEHKPIQVWTGDYLYVLIGDLGSNPPFSEESKRSELVRRLNDIPGVAINAVDRYPSIPLTTFGSDSALKQFLEVLDWAVREIKAT